ncbi:hypothetical protein [Streptomyces capitiformicae]|uniref:hypothetical protein n=1 Tax=Streptomyces capitiformicae TaxID=2014920 RepID=UPI001E36B727|nr:hypothetical protein [Streptomyces capitiformicae]
MREKNGDSMHKLKKAAAVAAMVGGISLAGGGVASAGDYDDPYPYPGVAIENLQVVECDQTFEPNTSAITGGAAGGDNQTNVGNFCTVVGEVED